MLLVLPLLGGCGDDDDDVADKVMATATATALPAAKVHQMNAAFVVDYRKTIPKAAKGLTDAQVVAVARRVCAFTQDPKAVPARVKADLSDLMDHNGVRPDVGTLEKVMKFAVGDTCPQQSPELARLL